MGGGIYRPLFLIPVRCGFSMVAGLQLSLDLAPSTSYNPEDFIIAECNHQAYELMLSWPRWPLRIAAIYGAEACGKTYLTNIWAARSGAVILNEHQFNSVDPSELINFSRYIAIEFSKLEFNERSLFHLINLINQSDGNLLLTSTTSPARWNVRLPDLVSRLRGAISVEIVEPDEETIYAFILKNLTERGVRIKPATMSYLLAHLPERTFKASLDIASQLDKLSLQYKREITIPLIRQILHTQMENA